MTIQTDVKPIRIRAAATADAPAIAELMTQLGYRATATEIAERLERLLALPSHLIVLAELEGKVVGWIAAELRVLLGSEPRVEIVGLVVAEAHRRSGIGSTLVGTVEQWQRDRGVSTILVRSNVARSESHPFYERLGYSHHKTQHAYRKRPV
jgi:GNAT superfamily N-acetyltransferase